MAGDHIADVSKMVCQYDPRALAGQPIGMYHCPECGEMVVAGMKHPEQPNSRFDSQTPPNKD